MRQTWRWFGPADEVSLQDIRQAGATGVVSALHQFAAGEIWPREDIAKRRGVIENAGLTWDVVESLPVSETIKTKGPSYAEHIAAYKTSLEALAAEGLKIVCYNFMPVLDWTRTDLHHQRPHGGTAMRFDLTTFAMFDCHVLKRPGARDDFSAEVLEAAALAYAAATPDEIEALTQNITCGLPGAVDQWSLSDLSQALAPYDAISPDQLRQNHVDFLSEIAPLAERLGVLMCCHPDDPPWPLLGLPRVVSTAADYRHFLTAVDSPSVGMTFCTGSLGARPDNDCEDIAREFAHRIQFVHLRNVTRETDGWPCSFFEDEHLEGQTDMVAVLEVLLAEDDRRARVGAVDRDIPFRPDHGQAILSDLNGGGQPGYPAVGRLKGLAELRGILAALSHQRKHAS